MQEREMQKKKIKGGGMIKNMKGKIRNSKGITLIALVITIIVLLILAGVSISTLVGDDGIIAKAQSARTANDIAKEKEAISLAVVSARVGNDSNIKVNADKLKEGLESLKSDGTIQDYEDPTADGVNEIKVTGKAGIFIVNINDGTVEEGSYDKWDGTSSSEPTEKTDTGIHIYTAAELKWLADEANSGNTFDGYTIYLESNLDFGARETNGEWETSENEEIKWTPIGSKDNDSSYRLNATFEGNNHIIKGIYVNQDTKFAGLFGNASSISNLTIKDSYIKGTNNGIGGIIAVTRKENSTISNCHNVNTTVVLENESAFGVRWSSRASFKLI